MDSAVRLVWLIALSPRRASGKEKMPVIV